MKISVLIFAIAFLFSCKSYKTENEIIIRGNVSGIPDGKIYLVNAYRWMTNLDSTTVRNGSFLFKITPDSLFYPYLAAIKFQDGNSTFGTGGLMFTNMRSTGFYLDRGITLITADTTKPFRMPTGGLMINANVLAGKQNTAFIDNSMNDFGWLGNVDSTIRARRIKYFHNQISKYPFSYHLFEGLFNARNQYSRKELVDFIASFDNDVQHSRLGEKFKRYLANIREPNSPYQNVSLLTLENKTRSVIDPNAHLNMLVFWASWCGPCRKEIPSLQRIFEKNYGPRFNLISISVDEKETDWRKAVAEEKMPWPQFLVQREKSEFIDGQYGPSVIPMIIFTDGSGNQIAKFVGFEIGQEKRYDSIITRYLSK